MKKLSFIFVLWVCFFVPMADGQAWWFGKSSAVNGDEKIKTIAPEIGVIKAKFLATGVVKPKVGAEVKVGSRVSGLVEKLYVKVGDQVKRGDPIAQIENRDLQARVERAEAALKSRRAEYEKIQRIEPLQISQQQEVLLAAKAKYDLAVLLVKRLRPLQKDDFVPQDELDNATQNFQVCQSELRAAKKKLKYLQEKLVVDKKVAVERIKEADANFTLAKINLGYARIKAPIDGVVSLVSTQKGETVAASFNAPTFVNIIDLNRLQVVAYVDEADIGKVALGQEVYFVVDAYPEKKFSGRVREIYPKAIVRNNVVSYEVMVEINRLELKQESRLRPEMSAYVTFIIAAKEQAILLPAAAVKLVHGKNVVYVKQGQSYAPREVKIGLVETGKIEIVSGLNPDEQVVVAGFSALPAD